MQNGGTRVCKAELDLRQSRRGLITVTMYGAGVGRREWWGEDGGKSMGCGVPGTVVY